jgi:hypothetical protein
MASTLFTQPIIACIWDFDKTLIPAYMQAPLFQRYGVDEANFWAETNALAGYYRQRGYNISPEISYLNHLLTYVRSGKMAGLNNRILRECGSEIPFYPGLPEFFNVSREWIRSRPEYAKHGITLEHYIVSTGLSEMIKARIQSWCHRRNFPYRHDDRQHDKDSGNFRDQQRHQQKPLH